MTRKFFLVVVLALQVVISYGCDACGCSFSDLGIGLLTGYDRTFVGIGLQTTNYSSTQDHQPSIQDRLYVLDVSLRIRLNARWQFQANVPFRHNLRNEPGFKGLRQGLSDIRIQGNYRILNQLPLGSKTFLTLDAGAGIQMPTGRYEYDLVHQESLPDNFSLGSGSWAPMFLINAILTHSDDGLILTGQYMQYLTNTRSIRFGPQTFLRTVAFHNVVLSNGWILSPFGGLQAEIQGWNRDENDLRMTDTYGYALSLPAGVGLDVQSWVLNVSTAVPVYQSFANGAMVAKPKFQVQFIFAF